MISQAFGDDDDWSLFAILEQDMDAEFKVRGYRRWSPNRYECLECGRVNVADLDAHDRRCPKRPYQPSRPDIVSKTMPAELDRVCQFCGETDALAFGAGSLQCQTCGHIARLVPSDQR